MRRNRPHTDAVITTTVSVLPGPSLFSEERCVCVHVGIPEPDARWLEERERWASGVFDSLVGTLELEVDRSDPGVPDLPAFIRFFIWLARCYLHVLDAYEGEPRIMVEGADRSGGDFGYHIAFSGLQEAVILSVIQLAMHNASACYPDEPDRPLDPIRRSANPASSIPAFLTHIRKLAKGRTVLGMQQSLASRRLPWISLEHYRVGGTLIQLGYGRFQHLLDATTSFESSYVGIKASLSKVMTSRMLADLGVPVAKQHPVNSAQEAVSTANAMGYPVVLKPAFGTHGTNVFVNLRDAAEVSDAFETIHQSPPDKATPSSNPIVVEAYVRGKDYRMTLVKAKMLKTSQRVPAQVIGDGERSVRQLVDVANRDPRRGDKNNPDTAFLKLQVGQEELRVLQKQGLGIDSVPDAGVTVQLRENANHSTGGTLVNVTDQVHPDNIALASRIATALGIDLLGLDVICEDIGVSYLESDLKVIEVNHSPGIGAPADPASGTPSLGEQTLDLLAPEALFSEVPIVVALADSQATPVTRAIGGALSQNHYCPGIVNPEGFHVRESLRATPASINPLDPSLIVLRSLEIDAAVVARAIEPLADQGIGTGGCDVAVLLSLPGERLVTPKWPTGIEAARPASLLLKAARKGAVVCVDEPELAALALDSELPSERLCVLSLQGPDGPAKPFLERGCRAVLHHADDAQGAAVEVIHPAGREYRRVAELPFSDADEDQSQERAALAAAGVLLCLDLPVEPYLAPLQKAADS